MPNLVKIRNFVQDVAAVATLVALSVFWIRPSYARVEIPSVASLEVESDHARPLYVRVKASVNGVRALEYDSLRLAGFSAILNCVGEDLRPAAVAVMTRPPTILDQQLRRPLFFDPAPNAEKSSRIKQLKGLLTLKNLELELSPLTPEEWVNASANASVEQLLVRLSGKFTQYCQAMNGNLGGRETTFTTQFDLPWIGVCVDVGSIRRRAGPPIILRDRVFFPVHLTCEKETQ